MRKWKVYETLSNTQQYRIFRTWNQRSSFFVFSQTRPHSPSSVVPSVIVCVRFSDPPVLAFILLLSLTRFYCLTKKSKPHREFTMKQWCGHPNYCPKITDYMLMPGSVLSSKAVGREKELVKLASSCVFDVRSRLEKLRVKLSEVFRKIKDL